MVIGDETVVPSLDKSSTINIESNSSKTDNETSAKDNSYINPDTKDGDDTILKDGNNQNPTDFPSIDKNTTNKNTTDSTTTTNNSIFEENKVNNISSNSTSDNGYNGTYINNENNKNTADSNDNNEKGTIEETSANTFFNDSASSKKGNGKNHSNETIEHIDKEGNNASFIVSYL